MGVVVWAVDVIHVGCPCPTPLTCVLADVDALVIVTAEHVGTDHLPCPREW